MDEATQQATPPPATPKPHTKARVRPTLSKEERSKVMTDAANRRWSRAKKAATKPVKAPHKPVPARKKATAPREFTSALKTAEKRLAKAIMERAEAANKYAVLNAEIPSLQRIILALRNPLGAMPENTYPGAPDYGMMPAPAPTLQDIVSDEPLMYRNPPRAPVQPIIPEIPIPQALEPANTLGRAGGGAIAVAMDDDEDENRFLKDSPVSGGEWH